MYLTISNADTGATLFKEESLVDSLLTSNKIEACRVMGVERVKKLVKDYRKMFPNATGNVDCQWERRTPGKDA